MTMNMAYKIGYYVFLAAVVVIALLLVATLFPIPGNFSVKIVQSGSMEPSIKTGSLVVVRPAELYSEGDVITFGEDTKEKIPTTHRIVQVRVVSGEYRFTTKGDANEDPDPREIVESDVHGKVLFSVPYAGYLIAFAREPIGFALLVGVPAGAIVLDEFFKIGHEWVALRRKKQTETEEETKEE